MNLIEWFKANKSQEIRSAVAEKCGTSARYLEQLAYSKSTKKRANAKMCEKLFFATKEITPSTVVIPKEERPDEARIYSLVCNEPQQRDAA